MDILIGCHEISKSFGNNPLFSRLSFSVGNGEKVGIVGANGAGKSTLVSILAGLEEADSGRVTLKSGSKLAYVAQDPQFNESESILGSTIEAAIRHGDTSEEAMISASVLLSQLGFINFQQKICELSGGWKKRLAIGQSSLGKPDLIFFDEPTNHLDWEGIVWLESFLKTSTFTWLMISHDRYLLSNVAQKIIDLDPQVEGGMMVTSGAYEEHLERKQAYLESRLSYQESLANKVRREDAWLKRGPKARGTKAKYRIDAAHKLKDELSQVRQSSQKLRTDIEFSATGRKTKKLIDIKELKFSYEDKPIINKLTTTITSGSRIGILGLNGVGKSSFFKLLTSQLKNQSGLIEFADQLKIVFFEQTRESLPKEKTLRQALWEHSDQVIFQKRSIHINSWAKRFGFKPDRLDTVVEKLSGGEQARILIARLMLKQADVLLLDEPSNDLDIATIEILEDSLLEFNGALLMISHDRYMLKRLCDRFLGFDGTGNLIEFASIEQWQDYLRMIANKNDKKDKAGSFAEEESAKKRSSKKVKKKFSYKEQREYDLMEEEILKAEQQLENVKAECDDPANLKDSQKMQELYDSLNDAQKRVELLYSRWTELESMIQ
ncbi:MAG: ABC-F family ATP-binding cassette domain-containing protein [Oligoflexales bacterium]